MPVILLFPSQSTTDVASSAKALVEAPLGQSAIIIETTTLMCARVSKRCRVEESHLIPTPRGTQHHSLTPTVYYHSLLLTLVVTLVIFSVIGIIALVTRDLRTVDPNQLSGINTAPSNEAKPLLGTTPSSTSPWGYQAIGARHPPSITARGSNRPVLQPLNPPTFIVGEYGDRVVVSPVEDMHDQVEPPTTITPRTSDVRGRALGVAQKTDPIGFSEPDIGIVKPQTFEPATQQDPVTSNDQTQVQHSSSKSSIVNQTSDYRAHTAPCIKNRSVSLAKSLTGLLSLRQAKVHVLGVGTSWEGIGDGSRALPGPSHDMEWLRKLFIHQENFRFDCLLDHDATLVTIRQSLDNMFSLAEEDDLLGLYFSSHGEHDDSFELYDSASLNEVMLNEWIVELRSKTSRNNPVYIIFDFC
ncbi:unnamed protein product [Rhizoctonia solani]|uniref:Peptidase C14 caspase domain-containing protein n=1 Tax=Rhizoctonia solani TaxID=456999 RepID=A0A8H2X0V3_9AGAM|nr:unnamed protein product [Rhizoctonia solani]